MDKKNFRVLIKHCFLIGKNTVDAKKCLDKRYVDSAPGKSTIIGWYAELFSSFFKQQKNMLRSIMNDPWTLWSPKISSFSEKRNKSPQNSFGRS